MTTNPRIPIALLAMTAIAVFAGDQQKQKRSAPAQQDDYILRSHSNLVVLDVSVTSGDGSPVTGLPGSRFRVAEDGRRQEIKQFSPTSETPVTIGLVVDSSGSMSNKAADVRSAIQLLLQQSKPHDQHFLVGFNDRPHLVLSPTMDAALQSLRMAGRTALYDGLKVSIDHLRANPGLHERRVLVLISDGRDTASQITRADLMNLVRESSATIYTVGLYFDEHTEERDSGLLRSLAKLSGGRFYHPETPEALQESCLEIARDIRSRYTIAYVPVEPDQRDGVRKIRVDLVRTAEDPRKLKVRTRSEYRIGGSNNDTTNN
jgi:Ca-activated chloride channel homolog